MASSIVRLPWFRVHIVVLNDPGRLLAVHIMHTALVCGWSSLMLTYELIIFDPTDSLYNPVWRQGSFVLEYCSRLGVVTSLYNWDLGFEAKNNVWNFEFVGGAHLLLSGLLILSALWHWSYWDIDVFLDAYSGLLVLDLNKIFGIHLLLASSLCFSFGYFHISGLYGPGIWCSDSFGILGSVRSVKPVFSLAYLTSSRYGVIGAHHIISGCFSLLFAFFHIVSRPQRVLFYLVRMSSIESVLSSSIIAVAFASMVNSALLWYGGVVAPIELYGPTRFHWDNSYFSQELDRRVKSSATASTAASWENVNDKLLLYDYIGSNPAKGGLFRSGPSNKGDGIAQIGLVIHTFL
jgi:photosystem II CP47 chlorophyll apoprotein